MSVDAAPPPPPPPPPPDFSESDQPVTDTGKAPPEETSPASTDTNAENGDPGTADIPMPGGQATPDLGDGETGGQVAGAGPDDSGAGDVVSGADQVDAADSGAEDADAAGSGGSGTAGGSQGLDLADVPVTDDSQVASGLDNGETGGQVAGAGLDDSGAGEVVSGADRPDASQLGQVSDDVAPDTAAAAADGIADPDAVDTPAADDSQTGARLSNGETSDQADSGGGEVASDLEQPDAAGADEVSDEVAPEALGEDGAADLDAAGSDGSEILAGPEGVHPADAPVADEGQIGGAAFEDSDDGTPNADQPDAVVDGTADRDAASGDQPYVAGADEGSDAVADDVVPDTTDEGGTADLDAARGDQPDVTGTDQVFDAAGEDGITDQDAAGNDQPDVAEAGQVADDVAPDAVAEDKAADLDAAGSDGSGVFGASQEADPADAPVADEGQADGVALDDPGDGTPSADQPDAGGDGTADPDAAGSDQLDVTGADQASDAATEDAADEDGTPDLDAAGSDRPDVAGADVDSDPAEADDVAAEDEAANLDAAGGDQPDVTGADQVSDGVAPDAGAEDEVADLDAAGSDGSGIFADPQDVDPADVPVTDDGQVSDAAADVTADVVGGNEYGAFDGSQDLDPADVPVTDDGQATPDGEDSADLESNEGNKSGTLEEGDGTSQPGGPASDAASNSDATKASDVTRPPGVADGVPVKLEKLPDGRDAVVIGNWKECGDNAVGQQIGKTCGICSCANVANQFGKGVTQEQVARYAGDTNNCDLVGGTNYDQRERILKGLGISSSLVRVNSLEDIARPIENGQGEIIRVYGEKLSGIPPRDLEREGQYNHAIQITGVARDPENGQIIGFRINNSAPPPGKEQFVPAELMEAAAFPRDKDGNLIPQRNIANVTNDQWMNVNKKG